VFGRAKVEMVKVLRFHWLLLLQLWMLLSVVAAVKVVDVVTVVVVDAVSVVVVAAVVVVDISCG
jgi:hypothetical protein